MTKRQQWRQNILDELGDLGGGFTTGDLAKKIPSNHSHNNREHSAAVRALLVEMESEGLVRKMDDLKPVCWIKNKGQS